MSRLSHALHHAKERVEEEIHHARSQAASHAPGSLKHLVEKVSRQGNRLGAHVLSEAKRAAHEFGRIHVAVHEKLPGVKQAEGALLRATLRGDTWAHVTGALMGLEIQQKAALSNRYSHSMGISEKQQKLARARSIALAASVAVSVVGAVVIAPAIAGAVAGAASSVGYVAPAATITQVSATSVHVAAAAPTLASTFVNAAAQIASQAAVQGITRFSQTQTQRYVDKYTKQVTDEYNAQLAKMTP